MFFISILATCTVCRHYDIIKDFWRALTTYVINWMNNRRQFCNKRVRHFWGIAVWSRYIFATSCTHSYIHTHAQSWRRDKSTLAENWAPYNNVKIWQHINIKHKTKTLHKQQTILLYAVTLANATLSNTEYSNTEFKKGTLHVLLHGLIIR